MAQNNMNQTNAYYPKGSLSPRYKLQNGQYVPVSNNDPSQMLMNPNALSQQQAVSQPSVPTDVQQAQLVQTQNQQTAAFPQDQQQQTIPTNNPSMSQPNPHQQFIQTAINQGYPPDMVMQFMRSKLNLG